MLAIVPLHLHPTVLVYSRLRHRLALVFGGLSRVSLASLAPLKGAAHEFCNTHGISTGAGGGYSGLCGALRELSVVLDRHQWLDGRALSALTGLRALSISETLDKERSQVLVEHA